MARENAYHRRINDIFALLSQVSGETSQYRADIRRTMEFDADRFRLLPLQRIFLFSRSAMSVFLVSVWTSAFSPKSSTTSVSSAFPWTRSRFRRGNHAKGSSTAGLLSNVVVVGLDGGAREPDRE